MTPVEHAGQRACFGRVDRPLAQSATVNRRGVVGERLFAQPQSGFGVFVTEDTSECAAKGRLVRRRAVAPLVIS